MKKLFIHFARDKDDRVLIGCCGETTPSKDLNPDDSLFVEMMKIFFGEPRRDSLDENKSLDRERILYSYEIKNVTCKRCNKIYSKGIVKDDGSKTI